MLRNQYDTDVTTWSPEGRLLQVEYAMEAVKQGSVAIGLRSKTHVVLACVNKAPSVLSYHRRKIFKVDDHIGVAIAGLSTDGHVLSRYMRSECINYSFTFESKLPVGRLVVQLADKAQVRTHQGSGKRPYGVGLLVGGLDESGAHIYYNCPSGNYFECQAFAIGSHSQAANTYMERIFQTFDSASREELIAHALFAIKETLQGEKLKSSICTITVLGIGEPFLVLDEQTVEELINSFEMDEYPCLRITALTKRLLVADHGAKAKDMASDWNGIAVMLLDLSGDNKYAKFMVQNSTLMQILMSNLNTSGSSISKEISFRIIANLARIKSLIEEVTSVDGLVGAIVSQVLSDDIACLRELFGLLASTFKDGPSAKWAEALLSDNIVMRVLDIAGSATDALVTERSVGFLQAMMANKHNFPLLFQTLVEFGLPGVLVRLLKREKKMLMGERLPERYWYPARSSIMDAIQNLCTDADYGPEICSNNDLFVTTVELVKIPNNNKIIFFCLHAAVIIEIIMHKAPNASDLATTLSDDFLFLGSLIDMLPFTLVKDGTKGTLLKLLDKHLTRFLTQFQTSNLSSLIVNQFCQMLTSKKELIEDMLLEGEQASGRSTGKIKILTPMEKIRDIVRLMFINTPEIDVEETLAVLTWFNFQLVYYDYED